MSLENLFEFIVPLIIIAVFALRGLFGNRPDPIDSFEPPPQQSEEALRRKREVERVLQTYSAQQAPSPGDTATDSSSEQSSWSPDPIQVPSYDEVSSRPKRLDTSSFRRERSEQSRSVSELRAEAAKLNRKEARSKRLTDKDKKVDKPVASAGTDEILSPERLRQSAREIFLLKELIDKPIALRAPQSDL